MQEYALRRVLSDELHARAFHDFEGAGRFIRFVYLVGSDDGKVVAYVNKFLSGAGIFHPHQWGKFQRLTGIY